MTKNFALLGSVLCFLSISVSNCKPAEDSTPSLIVSTTDSSTPLNLDLKEDNVEKEKSPQTALKIYQLKVDTNVTNRYAKTLIASKVRNLKTTAQETVFSVVIPDQAFISGFTMEVDGKSYEAYVQEKEQAKNTYNQAIASGQSAGHVAVSARDSNRFTVSLNLEPQSKATFYLRYEELLTRKNEKYELVLNIHPGQPIKDLEVTVNIYESRPLKFVEVPALRSGNEISKNDTNQAQPNAEIKKINETATTVTFNPNIEKQKELAKGLGATNDEEGLAGQFIVQYDVERDPQGGEVLVDGGYFVHFFSPEELPTLPKQVVFVLDTSGSMDGTRISQLKQAMKSILGELKPEDVFSIVEFNSGVKVWNVETEKVQYKEGDDMVYYYPSEPTTTEAIKEEAVLPPSFKATPENINKAQKVVKQLNAYGGTDIQSALKVGLEIVKKNKEPMAHQPLIIFLTDGEPTVGTVDTKSIISTISELDSKKAPIFSLSFGDGADRDFLEKLSLKNQGFSRHIYEASDAYLQLEDFYRQISSPLLTNVTFKYVENSVKNVTKTDFPILFRGGELAVAGHYLDPGFYPPAVQGWGIHGPISLKPKVYQAAGSLERLWAFQTIKMILRHRDLADDKDRYTQEALNLALKYSFVTDVSSLVVVKPNASSAVDTEDGSRVDNSFPISPQFGAAGLPGIQFAAMPAASFASGYAPLSLSGVAPMMVPAPMGGGIYHSSLALNEVPAAADYYQEDLVDTSRVGLAGGYPYLSTPFLPFPTTEISTEVSENPTNLPDLPQKLAWLGGVIEDNEMITLKQGTFKLGLNATVDIKPECQNLLSTNATGICTLVLECPEIHIKLTNLDDYSTYFCDLNGFAGVCCPRKEEEKSR